MKQRLILWLMAKLSRHLAPKTRRGIEIGETGWAATVQPFDRMESPCGDAVVSVRNAGPDTVVLCAMTVKGSAEVVDGAEAPRATYAGQPITVIGLGSTD
jgi:hypothetical protein